MASTPTQLSSHIFVPLHPQCHHLLGPEFHAGVTKNETHILFFLLAFSRPVRFLFFNFCIFPAAGRGDVLHLITSWPVNKSCRREFCSPPPACPPVHRQKNANDVVISRERPSLGRVGCTAPGMVLVKQRSRQERREGWDRRRGSGNLLRRRAVTASGAQAQRRPPRRTMGCLPYAFPPRKNILVLFWGLVSWKQSTCFSNAGLTSSRTHRTLMD